MNSQLERCLDDLAGRIDEAEEARVRGAWEAFCDGALTTGYFTPPPRVARPAKIDWPAVLINDALGDLDLMLLSEFRKVSDVLSAGGSAILNVRCNYGVSILASGLGCEVLIMPAHQGDTPSAASLGSEAAIRAAIDRGVPDHRAGQGAQVFDTAERFLEVFERWPVLGRWVALYHPDTQGPMDNLELAWGSDVFLALYDAPELVHQFLDLLTEHYIAFLRKWFELVPPDSPYFAHWGMLMKGRVMLRDDSLMNLPAEVYREFVRDREERCLVELGGGGVHFCGRGHHFIADLAQVRGLTAINLSQPHLNDMEAVYRQTIDRGIPLIGLEASAAANAGRDLRGRVHSRAGGVSPTRA